MPLAKQNKGAGKVISSPANKMKVFSGTASVELTNEICRELGLQPGKVHYEKFQNDNTFCAIQENVRECDVFLVQTSVRPVNDNLMEALITIDALVRASARRITMVMPYFAYARSDKKDRPRIPITASLVAHLLETAGADRLLTMDLHAEQIQGFFTVPVDQLMAMPIIVKYFLGKKVRNPVVVAPDAGSARRSGAYAERLHCPLAVIDKRRDKITGKLKIHGVVGEVKGMNAIILDDEINSGGSIISAIETVKEFGANDVYCGCTHPVFAPGAVEKLENTEVKEIVVTNTVPIFEKSAKKKLKILSVAPLFAKAIQSIHTGTSVSRHFK
ncbi:MAG TPA: ribose-phosphate pyrophosphokinase [Firmicutes bacterium]|nr:ribose-phosphate pyrophosphokinase [Bacillota bacterium]